MVHDFLFDVKTMNGGDFFIRVCTCGLTHVMMPYGSEDKEGVKWVWESVEDELKHTHDDDDPAKLVSVKSSMGFQYQDDDEGEEAIAKWGFLRHGKSSKG